MFAWHADGPGVEPGAGCDKKNENFSPVLTPSHNIHKVNQIHKVIYAIIAVSCMFGTGTIKDAQTPVVAHRLYICLEMIVFGYFGSMC